MTEHNVKNWESALQACFTPTLNKTLQENAINASQKLARAGDSIRIRSFASAMVKFAYCADCGGRGVIAGNNFSSIEICYNCHGSGVDFHKTPHIRLAANCVAKLAWGTWLRCKCKALTPTAELADLICHDCNEPYRAPSNLLPNPWPIWLSLLKKWWLQGYYDWLADKLQASGFLASAPTPHELSLIDGSCIERSGKIRKLGRIAIPFPHIPSCICEVANAPESPTGLCPAQCRQVFSPSGKPLYFVNVHENSQALHTVSLCEKCSGSGKCPRCYPETNPIPDDAKRLIMLTTP